MKGCLESLHVILATRIIDSVNGIPILSVHKLLSGPFFLAAHSGTSPKSREYSLFVAAISYMRWACSLPSKHESTQGKSYNHWHEIWMWSVTVYTSGGVRWRWMKKAAKLEVWHTFPSGTHVCVDIDLCCDCGMHGTVKDTCVCSPAQLFSVVRSAHISFKIG